MGLTYKAVQFRATKHHGADAKHSEHWDILNSVKTETGALDEYLSKNPAPEARIPT